MGEISRPTLGMPKALRGSNLAYVADPTVMLPGHRLRPLVDGAQTFPEMLAAIDAAQSFVHLETYIYEADRVGHRFAERLMARARAGVAVRLLIDWFGSLSLRAEFIRKLRSAGVQVVFYRPVRVKGRWARWFRRDHRKILVVDGVRAFTGGLNIGDQYVPVDEGGEGWRDTHLRVEGPVVADLESLFRATWHQAGGAPYPAYPRDAAESLATPDTELAAALASDDRGRRSEIRRHLLHAIAAARRSIQVTSAYFVPDRVIRRALIAAASRGVKVELILPGKSDVRPVMWAGESLYGQLLAGGVRIYAWDRSVLHAKSMVVDNVWSTVGSYNLDYVSLFSNLEVMVEIVGRDTTRRLRRIFDADRARCQEITLDRWRRRPWWRRALQWLAYRFRRWL